MLAGQGTIRIGDERVGVSAGNYIALPSGPEAAHQMTNTGREPLRYLCAVGDDAPEVTTYPDSDKVGILVGSAPGGRKDERLYEGCFRRAESVDYWDGEAAEVDVSET